MKRKVIVTLLTVFTVTAASLKSPTSPCSGLFSVIININRLFAKNTSRTKTMQAFCEYLL